MNKILESTKDLMKNDIPVFKSGDTLAVGVKVIEGEKSRIQMFEGVVIAISSGSGLAKTFTLRKVSNGVGVERVFPMHSPNLDSIKVVKKGKVSVWAKELPVTTVEVQVRGETKIVERSIHKDLEMVYLDHFVTEYGNLPPLNKGRK